MGCERFGVVWTEIVHGEIFFWENELWEIVVRERQ